MVMIMKGFRCPIRFPDVRPGLGIDKYPGIGSKSSINGRVDHHSARDDDPIKMCTLFDRECHRRLAKASGSLSKFGYA
jgi:hypothetical protein